MVIGIESPESVSVVYHNISWISLNEQINKTNRTTYEPAIIFQCIFDKSPGPGTHLYYKVDWYLNNGTIIQSSTIKETEIDQNFLSLMDLITFNQTAGSNVSVLNSFDFLTFSIKHCN